MTRTFQNYYGIKNVKDYGAAGDGVTDDTTSIQNAINDATAPYSSFNAGIVFFPPGTYKITSSLTFNAQATLSIIFLGCGVVSNLTANFSGFILDRNGSAGIGSGTKVVEKLYINNSHPSGGALRMRGCIGGAVRDCVFAANTCLDTGSVQSFTIQDCAFSTNGQSVNSTAIIATEDTMILNCDITGFDIGIAMSQTGTNVRGCRFEVNGTAIKVGLDPISGSNFASGFSILGCGFESNGTCVDMFAGCGYGVVGGLSASAFPSNTPYERTVISGTAAFSGSTTGAAGTGSISSAGVMTLVSASVGGWNNGVYVSGTSSAGVAVPTGTAINSQLTGNPSSIGTYALNGSAAYGIRVRNGTHDTVFQGLAMGGNQYVAGIAVENNDNYGNNTFIGCAAANSGGLSGNNWNFPTTAKSADFINCRSGPTTTPVPMAVVYSFANLPISSADGVVPEGFTRRISDGPTGLSWGNTVSSIGASPTHYTVMRNNSSAWVVIAP